MTHSETGHDILTHFLQKSAFIKFKANIAVTNMHGAVVVLDL